MLICGKTLWPLKSFLPSPSQILRLPARWLFQSPLEFSSGAVNECNCSQTWTVGVPAPHTLTSPDITGAWLGPAPAEARQGEKRNLGPRNRCPTNLKTPKTHACTFLTQLCLLQQLNYNRRLFWALEDLKSRGPISTGKRKDRPQ